MKSPIINGVVSFSAALLLAGCASSDYDTTDHTSYETTSTTEITEPSGAQPAAPVSASDQVVIPLHEERLNVGKRVVENPVVIHKVVTSEPASESVELRKETLSIEREPAGAAREPMSSSSAQPSPNMGLFEEGAVTIQLQEEQPVVEKTVVQKGEVVARKQATYNKHEVQDQVRSEDVRVDRSANTADQTIPGYTEPATGSSPRMNEGAGTEQPATPAPSSDY